ncbi:MAG: S8 family serine peptidase [Gracilimonas sp.]
MKDQWEGRINNDVAQEALQFVNNKIAEFGIEETNVKSRYEHALRGFAAKLTDSQLESIKRNPNVDFVEQDRRFAFEAYSEFKSSSPKSISEASLLMSQTTPWGVNRVGGTQDGTGKKAWVIDTGIDLDHPDLNIDVINSASFVASESADDIVGHGTHVAGTIAAKDNSQDVVGVAADATVVAVKVLHQDPNDNTYSDVVDGVNYVAGKASSNDIINMSLGAYDPNNQNQSIDVAVTNAANSGLRFTIAAGNSGMDTDHFTPARVEHSNVWTVSAYDDNDQFVTAFSCNPAAASNYGNPPIEYGGPGDNVNSLKIGGGIEINCGTSMAAPHIAGLLLTVGDNLYSYDTVSNDVDTNPDDIAVGYIETPYITASIDNDSPKISWNAIEGAASYRVFKRFEAGSWSQIANVTSTSYTDTFIINEDLQIISSPPFNFEDTYSYKVIAVPEAGVILNESNYVYYLFGECTGPGCAS